MSALDQTVFRLPFAVSNEIFCVCTLPSYRGWGLVRKSCFVCDLEHFNFVDFELICMAFLSRLSRKFPLRQNQPLKTFPFVSNIIMSGG
jgi:hypothetical protein